MIVRPRTLPSSSSCRRLVDLVDTDTRRHQGIEVEVALAIPVEERRNVFFGHRCAADGALDLPLVHQHVDPWNREIAVRHADDDRRAATPDGVLRRPRRPEGLGEGLGPSHDVERKINARR